MASKCLHREVFGLDKVNTLLKTKQFRLEPIQSKRFLVRRSPDKNPQTLSAVERVGDGFMLPL